MNAAGTPTGADAKCGTKHLAAVARTLEWADASADRGEPLDAIAWLGTLEAIGDEVPETYEFRRDTWSAELARTRAIDPPARHEKQGGVKL